MHDCAPQQLEIWPEFGMDGMEEIGTTDQGKGRVAAVWVFATAGFQGIEATGVLGPTSVGLWWHCHDQGGANQ